MESAQKLTTVITQIIEFAKMVPGFMSFPQDDQIVLLKGGTQLSTYYYYPCDVTNKHKVKNMQTFDEEQILK